MSLRDAIDSIGSFIKKSVDDGNKAGTFGIQIDTSQDRGRSRAGAAVPGCGSRSARGWEPQRARSVEETPSPGWELGGPGPTQLILSFLVTLCSSLHCSGTQFPRL